MRTIPNSVQDGMTVYDRGMNTIGVIETFRVGDDDPALPGAEAAGVSPILEQDQNSLTSILADIFSPMTVCRGKSRRRPCARVLFGSMPTGFSLGTATSSPSRLIGSPPKASF
jgi:hypothetical protein